MAKHLKLIIAAAVVVGVAVAALTLPLNDWLLGLVAWIREAGVAGVAVYIAVYASATVAMLPGSILTLGAGFAYGPLWGVAVVSPASVLGATLAFILGRTLLRDRVRRRVANNPKFAAIDRAVGNNGFKIVLLLRLSPIFPFNMLNYGLGLTSVRLSHYVLASFIGMLPGTVMFVYLGSLITNVTELLGGQRPDGGMWMDVLYWGGLVATVAVAVLVTRVARRALAEAVEASEPLAAAQPEA